MKIAIFYNWIIFSYLVLVTLLALTGKLAFGHGLGDLFYLIASGVFAVSQLITTVIIQRKKNGHFKPTMFYLCGTIFLLTALFLTWKFTIGRGPEYSWNGNIFY